MQQQNETKERCVLICADTGAFDSDLSTKELSALVEATGAETAGIFIQVRDNLDGATYIGKGKLEEVRRFCEQNDCTVLIADHELTGSQLRNIEEITHVPVIDRTMLILDIFALRAKSREGKLQVELAQQKYLLPRLIGLGNVLSRQGGGIGTRGPGETKLESDRRHIRRRIHTLSRELEELKKKRALIGKRRKKNEIPIIAVVGYTNVGKSTLLNYLTKANAYVQDQLFATLDPTARELFLPNGQKTVIIDTVGLLQRLPHELIEAFHSTLEVASDADVILKVCDYTDPNASTQLAVTQSVLDELGCDGIPSITVYNKTDCLTMPIPQSSDRSVFISAKDGYGVNRLLQAVEKALAHRMREYVLYLPYEETALLNTLRKNGTITDLLYENDGIFVRAIVDNKLEKQLAPFQKKNFAKSRNIT